MKVKFLCIGFLQRKTTSQQLDIDFKEIKFQTANQGEVHLSTLLNCLVYKCFSLESSRQSKALMGQCFRLWKNLTALHGAAARKRLYDLLCIRCFYLERKKNLKFLCVPVWGVSRKLNYNSLDPNLLWLLFYYKGPVTALAINAIKEWKAVQPPESLLSEQDDGVDSLVIQVQLGRLRGCRSTEV